ncbi:hypothetical protein CSKR_102270 [Clonorchis sinensis]|uniref:Uncharacterized protein n=1 Tax=Clonorchis sinensis TaxID=79923 RepID=A0A3R7FL22_CLOSI|nr:hypothetical protein CSKR_102270 [Clonorchis sinensis]
MQSHQSPIQRLLQAGEEDGRVASRSLPSRLGPPHILLSVGRCIKLRCKSFLSSDPVHLPRAASSRIQGRPRLASEERFYCRQLSLVGLQSRHLRNLQEDPHFPSSKKLWPRDLHSYPGDVSNCQKKSPPRLPQINGYRLLEKNINGLMNAIEVFAKESSVGFVLATQLVRIFQERVEIEIGGLKTLCPGDTAARVPLDPKWSEADC